MYGAWILYTCSLSPLILASNFGGTQEITAGSRARMQVRAVRERERASNEPSPGQLDL